MAINFPTSLDNDTSLPTVTDAVDYALAVHQNDPKLAIVAVETKLGYGSSTPTNGKFLVGNTDAGTSQWRVIADGDVPSALTGKTYNGLTLTAAATGFTIAGGTTSKTLTVSGDADVSGTNTGDQDLSGYVAKSTFDAYTILYADTDNTPAALSVGASTIVGRKSSGGIVALSASEARTILNVADGATANTKASGAEVNTGTDDEKFITPKALADSTFGNLKNPYKARAYLPTAVQADLTDNTATLVDLTAESYDPNSNFDTTNKKYVVPVTGYYFIHGKIRFTQVIADKNYQCLIYNNGSAIVYTSAHSSNTNGMTADSFAIRYLTANDEIQLYALANVGANTVDIWYGDSNTYLEIILLSL